MQIETDISAGRLGQVPNKTFGDLIDRYLKEVTPKKRGARAEEFRLRRTVDDDLGKVKLQHLGPEHFASWRDKRMQDVSAASVLREWATLAHVCNVAVKEWRWLRDNPLQLVKKPKAPQPRTRVITQDEVDCLILALGNDYSTATGRVGLALLFALETGMRAGEICGLTWEHVYERHVHIPISKNGSSRDVPLSVSARAFLEKLPAHVGVEKGDKCFALHASILDALFRKAKARALITDLHFHDSRATALTRLANIFNVMELARVSGHRDLRILVNTYYRPSVEDLADKLTSHPVPTQ